MVYAFLFVFAGGFAAGTVYGQKALAYVKGLYSKL